MSSKTLFDFLRPICSMLNLFGFNFGNEKPEGCLKKIYKWAVKSIAVYQIWKMVMSESCADPRYDAGGITSLNWNLLLISSCGLHFFCVNEREMERVMMRLKEHPVGKTSGKRINKQLIPYKIYFTLIVVGLLALSLGYCVFCMMPFIIYRFMPPLSYLFRTLFIIFGAIIGVLYVKFPTLLCILPCVVARYCRAEMDEAIEELKRIKSPLRRAKASAKLIEKYHRLYQLASDTDRALSSAMYAIKWPFLIAIAITQMAFTSPFSRGSAIVGDLYSYYFMIVLIFIPSILTYVPFLQYFYLAPSANQMFNLMNRAMVDCHSIDDEWLPRDPILRPYLLRMRMKQIEQLRQMASEEPPFTLSGEVISDDVFYMIILDIIDMCNTLSVHESSEAMAANRILRNFMEQLSFNCSSRKIN